MKKFGMFAICSLLLFTGCGEKKKENSWGTQFQVSEFKWKESAYLTLATGTIKNNSSKTCNSYFIDFLYKNGSLIEEGSCLIYGADNKAIEPGETTNAECIYTGDLNNIEDYSISVTNIQCRE